MAIFHRERLQTPVTAPSRHTVLLVDDEADNLKVLCAILGARYRVLQACDGQEALELVQAMDHVEDLALVISDQRMPRMTGVELCEQLCEISPDTLRIIVTGYMDVDAIVDSVNRARIYQFVIKPFDRHDFELTVQRAIEAHDMKRRLDAHVLELEAKVQLRTLELSQRNEALQLVCAQLEACSLTDPLTGLHNRRYLQGVIEKDIALACRSGESGEANGDLVFFLVDCDHFKQVNDSHGHDVGDRLLCAIAEVLRQVFRSSDYLVRWGGEEFLVVARFLPRGRAAELAERLRLTMAQLELPLKDGSRLFRTCSIGYAALPFLPQAPQAAGWEQVVKLADCAMYGAKHSGRNTWIGLKAGVTAGPQADALPAVQQAADIPALLSKGLLGVEAALAADQLRWA
nr:diguanylate cyclase [uncultured Roseateles sp.]